MGLGDTEGLLEGVRRGIDLFDCVLPTRVARHGKALTRTGDLSMRRAEWVDDGSPLEKGCPCIACQRYSRGYIRHLVTTRELLAHRLLTLHNLTYTLRLMKDVRYHIAHGSFESFAADVVALRQHGIERDAS
jgi:queuine tRNA-ribosyltransferase